MAKYLIEASYSADGFKALRSASASARKEAVAQALASVGGTLESMYFCLGEHDVVIICDVPDAITAIAISSAACASGQVRTTTTPLLTPAEVDQAFAKGVTYRPPGS